MTTTLNAVKAFQNPDLIAEAAKKYGENEVAITKAINSIPPTLLIGLLAKSGDSHSIDELFQMLRDFNPQILDRPDSLLDEQADGVDGPKADLNKFMRHIFGAKIPAITNTIAAFSAVKPSTASALLGLTGPLLMGVLSQQIHAEKLNPYSLVSTLLRQKPALLGLLPANVAAMLGVPYAEQAENRLEGVKWLWPLLLLIALGVAVIFYLKR